MSDITVKELKTNRELKQFVLFPEKLYRNCENYVPPLISDELSNLRRDKNPAYEFCDARFFMAYRDGEPVGRICALHNKLFNEVWHQNCLRFTRYDTIDDIEVSRALFAEVEKWARELGLTDIQGPTGYGDLDHQGLLVDGFNERGLFITTYNYAYYKDHLEALGYGKHHDWIEYEIAVPEKIDERFTRIADYAMKKANLHVLELKKTSDVLPYVKGVFELVYDAYRDVYGAIPLTDKQIELYKKQFMSFLKPEYLTVILNSEDKPVALGMLMPSLAEPLKKCRGKLFPFGFIPMLRELGSSHHDIIELMLVGVSKDLMNLGVNAKIITEMFRGAKKFKFKYAETGPMREDNIRIQSMWKNFGHRQHKRRRCYCKAL